MLIRFPGIALLLTSLVLIDGCASGTRSDEDSRLAVDAAMTSRRHDVSTAFLYVVRIRNLSERTLSIRTVQVDPIGGGSVMPAHAAPNRDLEPGEDMELAIWAELDSKEILMGVGDAIARIIVTFDDGSERVLGSYLVELK